MDSQRPTYDVLVVEDNPDHAFLIQAVFGRKDPRALVRVVASAEEAIAYIKGPWPDTDWGRSHPPDIIVLDVRMPGIGGLGLLNWLQEEYPREDIPTIVFTSADDPELARQCFALGAVEFRMKPTDFSQIVDVVHGVLARPQVRRSKDTQRA